MACGLPLGDTLVRGRFFNGVTASKTAPHSFSGRRLVAPPCFVPTLLAFLLTSAAFALCCNDLFVPDALELQRILVKNLCVCHALLVIL